MHIVGRSGSRGAIKVLVSMALGSPRTLTLPRSGRSSPRSVRDSELTIEIQRVFDENLFVYGAEIWASSTGRTFGLLGARWNG